jgi:N-formylglutamate deformylase
MTTMFPPWVLMHIPHSSTLVPSIVRDQFLLTEEDLIQEINLLTDHHTLEIFTDMGSGARSQAIVASVSRLVVDVERHLDDVLESMAVRGMGVIYALTSMLRPLRKPLTSQERRELIETYYTPHHSALEDAVADRLERFNRCLILDCHSFADKCLPYELGNSSDARPDICLGTDPFHTDPKLTQCFVDAACGEGFSIAVNHPFSGSMVPASRYKTDERVALIMVEINKRLYLVDDTTRQKHSFVEFGETIRKICGAAVWSWCDEHR